MVRFWKVFFIFFLIFSIYHIIRDVLQIAGIHNFISDFARTTHRQNQVFWDYITFPYEIFVGVSSAILLKRNKSGLLGKFTFAVIVLWIATFLFSLTLNDLV